MPTHSNAISVVHGYSRPSRNVYELIKRLKVLVDSGPALTISLQEQNAKLERLKQRLAEVKLVSKGTAVDKDDILCQEKEIKRQEEKIAATEKALQNSQFHIYEIKQIEEKLNCDENQLHINSKENGLISDLEAASQPLPYNVSDEILDKAIASFESAKASDNFSVKSKAVFNDGIILLKGLRSFRTFKHYDLILTGAVILVMMHEDQQYGPFHPKGANKFFYKHGLHKVKGLSVLEVGKLALLEKKLLFDGTCNLQLFDFLQPVFPNYLAKFYGLNTDPLKLDTTRKTQKYHKKKTDKKLLKYFKDAYLKEYKYALFKNPFSKMKLHLEDKSLTMKDVRAYVETNPNSRSARVLKIVLERDTQRNRIKLFTDIYFKIYSQKKFKNPFSFMRRNVTKLQSTQEIYQHVQNNARCTSTQAFNELVRDERELQSFLKK